MNYLKPILFLSLFCLPIGLFAQSGFVGDWTTNVPDQNGNMMTIKVTMAADNTYAVDFGADGRVEITGTYSIDGSQVTIQDNSGSDCTGKGVYKFEVSATELKMEQVSEECPGRGGPEGKMNMTRA